MVIVRTFQFSVNFDNEILSFVFFLSFKTKNTSSHVTLHTRLPEGIPIKFSRDRSSSPRCCLPSRRRRTFEIPSGFPEGTRTPTGVDINCD